MTLGFERLIKTDEVMIDAETPLFTIYWPLNFCLRMSIAYDSWRASYFYHNTKRKFCTAFHSEARLAVYVLAPCDLLTSVLVGELVVRGRGGFRNYRLRCNGSLGWSPSGVQEHSARWVTKAEYFRLPNMQSIAPAFPHVTFWCEKPVDLQFPVRYASLSSSMRLVTRTICWRSLGFRELSVIELEADTGDR